MLPSYVGVVCFWNEFQFSKRIQFHIRKVVDCMQLSKTNLESISINVHCNRDSQRDCCINPNPKWMTSSHRGAINFKRSLLARDLIEWEKCKEECNLYAKHKLLKKWCQEQMRMHLPDECEAVDTPDISPTNRFLAGAHKQFRRLFVLEKASPRTLSESFAFLARTWEDYQTQTFSRSDSVNNSQPKRAVARAAEDEEILTRAGAEGMTTLWLKETTLHNPRDSAAFAATSSRIFDYALDTSINR